jgi:hypothetical protein
MVGAVYWISMRSGCRKCAVIGILGVCLLGTLTVVSFCAGPPRYYREKYEPSSMTSMPLAVPVAFAAEKQTEPHTCGFHAVSTVYRAYGLDPDGARLRFRLGTDKRATNFDPESLGTIHPDMLRVLSQDGFDASLVLDPKSPESMDRVAAHLGRGHPVIALVRATGLHWIVLAPHGAPETALDEISGTAVAHRDEAMVLIIDSLVETPTAAALGGVLSERVLSAIVVQPKR